MMATAGGVAIGSTVGHVLGHAMTGGGSREGGEATEAAPEHQSAPAAQQQQGGERQVCGWEMKQFLNCAQTQHDLSLCEGFSKTTKMKSLISVFTN
jgi:hypothetical protein